ncbi:GNAT family N-acetyltransferase [Actinocorallia longicatena]|uniref:GNAT family N-acetyltransferase n=1 Tax=Actinocorallia longicatena TaxID=111803 RepID=A0ABP6QJ02_9ACTN
MTLAPDVDRHTSSNPKSGWVVEVNRDDDAFITLADDWRDLYRRCSAATPFQSQGWLASWWNHYGKSGDLRLVLVRHQGRLVAAAPLMSARRGGLPVLLPLGGALADFTDLLLDEEAGPGALEALIGALTSLRHWQAIDLGEVRPGSVAHAVAQRWPGGSWVLPASLCMEVPVMEPDAFLRRFPSRTAGKMRARLRAIQASGIIVDSVGPEAAEASVHVLLRLHEEQWRGRGVNQEHLRSRFAGHLAQSTEQMIRQGQAALHEYRLDGRVVAADLVIIGNDMIGGYLYGAVPDLRDRIEVSLLLLRQNLHLGQALKKPRFSMLRGGEAYKEKWLPEAVCNERIILGRTNSAQCYVTALRGRRAVCALLRRLRNRAGTPTARRRR